MKKVKTTAKKAKSSKVNHAATTQDNAKRTLIKKRNKTTQNKGKRNKTPDIGTATQENEGRILPPD